MDGGSKDPPFALHSTCTCARVLSSIQILGKKVLYIDTSYILTRYSDCILPVGMHLLFAMYIPRSIWDICTYVHLLSWISIIGRKEEPSLRGFHWRARGTGGACQRMAPLRTIKNGSSTCLPVHEPSYRVPLPYLSHSYIPGANPYTRMGPHPTYIPHTLRCRHVTPSQRLVSSQLLI